MSTFIYLPNQNKYYKWYQSIIVQAQIRNWTKQDLYQLRENDIYIERHHIIPSCFFNKSKDDGFIDGNPNDIDNLVYLTTREHYICHQLLTYCYNGLAKRKMYHAFNRMHTIQNNSQDRRYITSSGYELAKKLFIIAHSGINSPVYKGKLSLECNFCKNEYLVFPSFAETSKYCSMQCKADHQKQLNTGINNSFFGKSHSQETKDAISDKNSGKAAWNKGITTGRVGADNTSARKILVIDPDQNEYYLHGEFIKFCKGRGLPISVMWTIGNGKIPKKGKCVGYQVKFLE